MGRSTVHYADNKAEKKIEKILADILGVEFEESVKEEFEEEQEG